jgi:hypothetical protein
MKIQYVLSKSYQKRNAQIYNHLGKQNCDVVYMRTTKIKKN